MPRKALLRSIELPYHITSRTNNRELFPGDLNYTWKVLTNELYLQFVFYRIRIHAFVLMPNHFHLLITSPSRDIDLVMKEVLGSTTRILNTKHCRSGHIFGGRYFWSLIQEPAYFAHALKYVYRNPVKAGICENVGEYPFSTYAGIVGEAPLPVPICPPFNNMDLAVPKDLERLDQWINAAHSLEQNEAIKKALRRKRFEIFRNRKTRRPIQFET
jgi:putative transposase